MYTKRYAFQEPGAGKPLRTRIAGSTERDAIIPEASLEVGVDRAAARVVADGEGDNYLEGFV